MSSADLKNFLVKLDNELMRGKKTRSQAVQAYRTQEGDKKESTLTYSPKPITDALSKLGGNVPENLQTQYNSMLSRLNTDMFNNFTRLRDKYPQDVSVWRMGDTIGALITKRGTRDNYGTLKSSYKETLDKFYLDFLTLINKPKGLVRLNAKGKERVYEPGSKTKLKVTGQTHEGGGSNVLNQMNDAVYAAIEKVNAESTKVNPNVKQELKDLQRADADIILKIVKDGKMGTVNLGISSSLENSRTGGGINEQGLRDELDKAITSLSEFLKNTKGSDSLTTAHRKKLVKELVKPFKNKKGIKLKHESIKITENKAPTTLTKKSGKRSIAKAAASNLASKGRVRSPSKRKAKPPRMALKNILGLLNAKLPQQVADNMGAPRLENRTGRFAQSVRAVDVQETAKGFKSIGYLYQKDPYQAFESTSGTRFSSAARDPRTLIDTSIREIVAQFGLGRLYTRRL